jgi:hypothetical protein
VLVLFDPGTPRGLAQALPGHTIHTARSRGWNTLSNGALLNAAEAAGFDLLLTTDRRIRYQQNLRERRIALVVLTGSTKWSLLRQHAERVAAAVASATPGSYAEVDVPLPPKPRRD